MKLKELPESFRDLAIKNQKSEGKRQNVNVELVNAFDWKSSPEGGEFWWEVENEEYHVAIRKNNSDTPMVMITYNVDYSRLTTQEHDITAHYKDETEFGMLIGMLLQHETNSDVLVHSHSTPEVIARRKEMEKQQNNFLDGFSN